MTTLRVAGALIASILLVGSAVAQSPWSQNFPAADPATPPAAKPKPAPAPKFTTPSAGGGTRVVVVNTCADITLLVGLPAGAPLHLEVDGKVLGTAPYCDYASFAVPAGNRKVRLINANGIIDLGFGHVDTVFAAGTTTYMRARVGQYVDWNIVPADNAKGFMATINKHHGRK